ncbi:sigma-54-dependent transcriptional regulator [Granulosicoccus antarcticus]|uniref:Transcriptional regulatory protein ZraR n=1 Tax=Granulosicoccus antarcticus IMCC3135 TaxID=1192854 RepID=A0A2Z2P7R0_9GAMM|nr:sigma-54 dependent transcriptional regulator [Granulosicoccus antarcticus]ASJ75864.1 Transcriptional regulatory protein ZraR [Granulosicoccus antarcticus IMCC3135]
MTHTALIIDDEADIRELIALSLDRIGLTTHTAANLEEARNLLQTYQFDVCLTDMRLPDGNGVEFVKHILAVQPDLPVAVITAHGNMDAAVVAMKNGAFDFVSKPVDMHLLRKLVTQAIKANEGAGHVASPSIQPPPPQPPFVKPIAVPGASENDVSDSQENSASAADSAGSLQHLSGRRPSLSATALDSIGAGKLIGRSEPMQALRKMISKVARTNAPVWITGESGTGKELIARLVHEHGPRCDAPFVAINCGAIPTELMESEMFGHRKGSFTGAHSDHDGLFKKAEGGTLFLDEVAELPLHMQVKLLRAIQERSIRPVGSSEELMTDVRILSASHKDLAAEVEAGSFRHDLYYRLNVICIESPSLRQRSADVADIARHILRLISTKEGLSTCIALSPAAENVLTDYAFPGNVRELENILERAVALTDGHSIDVDDLSIDLTTTSSLSQTSLSDTSASNDETSERQVILGMLAQTRWNRKLAAQRLGLTYRQLRYRIQILDIDQKDTGT